MLRETKTSNSVFTVAVAFFFYVQLQLLMAILWAMMELTFALSYFNLAHLNHKQRLEDTLQCSYVEASIGNFSVSVPPSPHPPRRSPFSAVMSPAFDSLDSPENLVVPEALPCSSSPTIQARLSRCSQRLRAF